MDNFLNWNFLWFILFGFVAQMIDGSLGMAYGVSSNSLLLTLGLPPKIASASIKSAEMFTTLVSGISHWKFGNIDKALFKRLVVPGAIGGVVGAYLLSNLEMPWLKAAVSGYLLLIGAFIIYRAFKEVKVKNKIRVAPLGFVGGLFDAIGGGGWGPIVTTNLVADGNDVKKTIGSVNAAEFFVTVVQAFTFFAILKLTVIENLQIILGLLVGGVIAAPLGALVCKKLPRKPLMIGVGLLIIACSARIIYYAVFGG